MRPWTWTGVVALLLVAGCAEPGPPPQSQGRAPGEGAKAGDSANREGRPSVEDASGPAPARAETTAEHPALVVQTLDGETWDLSTRRGQWVVVNYWATWCAPCIKEMPELSELDAGDPGLEVIGLAYEDIEPAAMRAFLQKVPVVYPVAILDLYAPPADFAAPVGLPLTYLIDPEGRVAGRFLGPVTGAEIRAVISRAATGPSVAEEPARAGEPGAGG